MRLAGRLAASGWSLDPGHATAPSRRRAIEVYPHVATVGLLGLERTIKYKKGRIDARRAGLASLQARLHAALPTLDPALEPFCAEAVTALRGRALKDLEDRLDALVCAAMALRFALRPDRIEVIGDAAAGYVVVPRVRWRAPARTRSR